MVNTTCSAPAVNSGAASARANSAFAYDPDRKVMLLFGGGTAQIVNAGLAETWTWDGQGWSLLHPADSPPGYQSAAMTYDPIRHQMVLSIPFVGGIANPAQTWTWDGVDWVQQHPSISPPSRLDPVMIFDATLGGVVLVGGTDSSDRSDVWLWDGANWKELAADRGPFVGAAHAAMVAQDGSLVVVGSNGTFTFANGAWKPYISGYPLAPSSYVGNVAWMPAKAGTPEATGFVMFNSDGGTVTWLPGRDSAWRTLKPTCSPPARFINAFRPAMAYDGALGVVVLFGGRDRNDTWTFDGTTWTPILPCGLLLDSTIGPRWWPAMAFDEARGNAVIFGGTTDFGQYQSGARLAETLTWTPGSKRIVPASPAVSPSAREGPGMVYDAARKQVLLFGGRSNSGYENDTWIWDGSNWTLQHPAHSPGIRSEPNLVYDPDHSRVLLVGGIGGSGGYQNDTWAWDGLDWTQLSPPHPPQLSSQHSEAMAYAAETHRVVLLAMGTDGTAHTYLFDGSDWSDATAAGPSSSFGSMSSYPGGIIFFAYPGQVWRWDGVWHPEAVSGCQPGDRRLAASTYDPVMKEFVIFGGLSYDAKTGYADLWVWTPSSRWRNIA